MDATLDIIEYINSNFDSLTNFMKNDILALINEWNKVHIKYFKTAHNYKQVGLLSIKLLEKNVSQYARHSELSPLLETLAFSISCLKDEINAFLDKYIYCSKKRNERAAFADTLRKIFLENPISSAVVCRIAPEISQKLALHEWLLDNQQDEMRYGYHSFDIEEYFGLEKQFTSGFFPESGAKGFFQVFFQEHPWKALDFSIQLVNYSTQKYHVSNQNEEYSDIYEETLCFADGTSKPIICSAGFWSAYRGTAVFPDVLQCLLMAMENWLIMVMEGNTTDDVIKQIFEFIINESNSCCTLAVLASIATGFPDKCGKYVLPILSVKSFYGFDIARIVNEPVADWNRFGFRFDPYAQFYAQERKKSLERPWRNTDLRSLAQLVQIKALPGQLYFISALKNENTATQNTDLSLLLHQIDIQKWKLEETDNGILFSPPEITDNNLKDKISGIEKDQAPFNDFLKLRVWVENHIRQERQERTKIPWEEALATARQLKATVENGSGDTLLHRPYIIKSAAVLLKNYLAFLSDDDKQWCLNIIAETIETSCDRLDYDRGATIEPVDQYGIGICAHTIPLLYRSDMDTEYCGFIKKLLLLAITHRSKLVRVEVAKGVTTLWDTYPKLAKWCLWCAVEYARFTKSENMACQFSTYQETIETICRLRCELRTHLFENPPPDGLLELSFEQMSANDLLEASLMLPASPISEQHISFAKSFLEWLCLSDHHKYSHDNGQDNFFSFEIHAPFAEWLGELCFNHTEVILQNLGDKLNDACEHASSFTHILLLQILMHCERAKNCDCYKKFFELLMQKLIYLSVKYSGNENTDFNILVKLFINATSPWIMTLQEQNALLAASEIIVRFSRKAACHDEVFLGLSSLICKFPEIFLNDALEVLAEYVQENPTVMNSYTVVYCEIFLHKYLMNSSGALSAAKYKNINILLDYMVEKASAKAYFLREHLVRSRKIEN